MPKAPQVDFYLIPEATVESSLDFVCRLLEKAYQQKHRIYVQLNNAAEAQALDELLWTFREDSFIPHACVGQPAIIEAPILIGHAGAPAVPYDILINLSNTLLTFYNDFKRVIEIVRNESAAKNEGREKFRHYKAAGCKINTHDLVK